MQNNTEPNTENKKRRRFENIFFEHKLSERGTFIRPGITSRFFLMLCVPILIVMFFVYTCNSYYSKQYREILTSAYSSEMNKFLQSSENEFMNASKDASLLMSIPTVSHLSYTGEPIESLAYDEVQSVQSSLYSFTNRLLYADNVIIVNRSGNFVISYEGIFDIDTYFNSVHSYSDYNADFWRTYRYQTESAQVLSPTGVSGYEKTKTIFIPIVYPVIGEKSSSLFIFNISSQKLYDEFIKHKFTKNSTLCMLNNKDGEVFTSSVSADNSFKPDLSAANVLYDTSYYRVSDININGESYYLLTSQDRYGTFGYTYIGAIPYSDIDGHAHMALTRILLLAVLIILVMLLYAYVGSVRLSRPWRSIAKKLSAGNADGEDNGTSKKSDNVISYVNEAISALMDKNSDLTHNLTITLPRSQEKYLVDILNNPASDYDDEMDKLIFKHEYFVSTAINISLKQTAGSDVIALNPQLYSEVYKAIESVFAARFNTFSLPSTNNTLYLILNIDTVDCTEPLSETIEQIKSLLAADSDYIDVFIGTGKVYKGIDGLRLSHQEAMADIFHEMNANKIQIVDNHNLHEYSFGVYNENILINYILTGHTNEAADFIRDTFESCSKSSPENRSQVYSGIFRAIGKVIKVKKIRATDFESKTEDEILSDILSQSDESVMQYLLNLTQNIAKLETPSGKARIAEIADYIKEHFDEDLCLDGLAQMFNVTPKYLSKVLKDHLGISFKSYLTSLRIDKAEELLTRDDIKINEICKMVGFMNHSAFIRAFKQKNGISPSEYRNLYQKRHSGGDSK